MFDILYEIFMATFGGDLVALAIKILLFALGFAAYKVFVLFANTKAKKDAALSAVRAVEQLFKDLHGEDKLKKAMERMEQLLAQYKIPFDADEAMILIHAALAELNGAFQKVPVIEASAVPGTDENTVANSNSVSYT